MNPTFGGKKNVNRNWQTGKVLDSQRSQELAGTVDDKPIIFKRWRNASQKAVYQTRQTFVIEGETLTYTVLELVGRGVKPANLTVNGNVRFAVEGLTLYFIDDDYREHETEIVKKVLRKE